MERSPEETAELAEQLEQEEDFDIDGTDYPVCPHCGKEDIDWSDGIEKRKIECGRWDVRCGFCGVEYHVNAEFSVSFYTKKP